MKRTQIYLGNDQARALADRARRRETTASHVIREAVDAYLAQPESEDDRLLRRWHESLDESFGAAPGLPSGADYIDHVRAPDAERALRLDAPRRS